VRSMKLQTLDLETSRLIQRESKELLLVVVASSAVCCMAENQLPTFKG
jgi:hypothetical protein